MRYLILLVCGLLLTPTAWAVQALSTEELVSHCDMYHDQGAEKDRIFCVRYIQGFIDGAVATDERVAQNIVKEYEENESFSQRAARTRIGSRLDRYGSSVYAEFCLGDPVPLKEVVERVVDGLKDQALLANNPLARDLVYQALRTNYPCSKID
ncbi:Rap1a/Tai family immunity protein [Pseudomonadota bacterium]